MSNMAVQSRFFARIADPQALRVIFEHLPGVFFFVKDDQGRHIAANSATFERFGIKHEHELVGTMDERWFPPEVAKEYRRDDQQVIRTGKPVINRLEVWYDEQRNLDWFLCTKLPVYGKGGKIIGVMGITRRDEERLQHYAIQEVTDVVGYLRNNARKNMTTAELAHAVGASERNLHRKIKDSLGTTPHELMLRMRIQGAAEVLAKTTDPITVIADAFGFCDQSAFTQQFRKRTGMTPKQFRMRHTA